MIKIRLQRKGRIRRPIYHIVVADSRSPRDGRIIEQVGRYDGVTEKKETIINEERISYWLDQGAKPTDAVHKILRHQGFLYKRHLQMWGKSEEEINAAIDEWKANRESKEQAEVSRKDQVRASLIAEEKEVKKQIKQKASAAAAEMEKEAEEPAAEAAAEETADLEPETKAATEETAAEQVAPAAEETADPEPETKTEAATEEAAAEQVGPAAEETADLEPETEAATEETATEQEAPAAEETADPEPETEIKQQSGKRSADMTAKEAVNHIAATALENLDGFVADSEVRKTVLAAWEAKKNTK
ncbi:MAG: 30S ribosomal protein S16 [Bacteroidota bacterium]|nr:30S ribosomal protein S16 [Bacteroidota bacterium]